MTARPRPPTIKDAAHMAAVGIGTVSRCLNSTGAVSADPRRCVAEAIAQLGDRSNAHAAALRGKSARIIGVLAPDLESPAISWTDRRPAAIGLAAFQVLQNLRGKAPEGRVLRVSTDVYLAAGICDRRG